VHRDIKPANLLVGPGCRVKITDFGIAYAAGSAPITRTGMLVGTPAYLAPERAAGGPATPATDLYSLGVVGYACLAGAPPFSGIPLEVAAAHRHRELPPLPSAVPAGVAGLVGELTAKDPAARPASAGDVARRAGRLRDALASGTTVVLPSGPAAVRASEPATLAGAPAQGRPPRRPSGVLLAVAGAVLMAGLGLWLLASSFGGASPQHHPRAAHVAARTPGTSAVRTVEVNAAALTGQPAGLVLHRLREAGLDPRVVRAIDGGVDPGTVISVHPSGQVPAGSVVRLTVALPPPGHRHDHGHDHGHGHGHGDQGGGNGQGDINGGGD
jgi:protein kinase-like protein/PASTA domain-containing protein